MENEVFLGSILYFQAIFSQKYYFHPSFSSIIALRAIIDGWLFLDLMGIFKKQFVLNYIQIELICMQNGDFSFRPFFHTF